MNKSLQGRFREVMHNNYTLYYFAYMYTQICDEHLLIVFMLLLISPLFEFVTVGHVLVYFCQLRVR